MDSPNSPSLEEQISNHVNLICHGIPKNTVAQGGVAVTSEQKEDGRASVEVYGEKAMISNEKLRGPHESAKTMEKVCWKSSDIQKNCLDLMKACYQDNHEQLSPRSSL
ncbi:hypothetical protein BUALT_Bualt11G0056800 [Buddleja alternifolia]|uniref:Uncharacterized protein n=1 Tax=Buddleja alternifolia TaxID=168488 RepID=A0AAV6X0U9_9LAMI|nr:hypothetical protein BUALT_Bualt11G0056800 [Buddleja alternifolia]